MVELRKRKTPPPAPEPKQQKARKTKAKATGNGGKPAPVEPVAESSTTAPVEDEKPATNEPAAAEPATKEPAKEKHEPSSAGEKIDLDGFGGEITTNDGDKTNLKSLVEDSEAGVVLFTYPKASTPGCRLFSLSLNLDAPFLRCFSFISKISCLYFYAKEKDRREKT